MLFSGSWVFRSLYKKAAQRILSKWILSERIVPHHCDSLQISQQIGSITNDVNVQLGWTKELAGFSAILRQCFG